MVLGNQELADTAAGSQLGHFDTNLGIIQPIAAAEDLDNSKETAVPASTADAEGPRGVGVSQAAGEEGCTWRQWIAHAQQDCPSKQPRQSHTLLSLAKARMRRSLALAAED
jgi:hypothetical protein